MLDRMVSAVPVSPLLAALLYSAQPIAVFFFETSPFCTAFVHSERDCAQPTRLISSSASEIAFLSE